MSNGGLRLYLKNFAKGMVMGGADVVPGISGGTVALIVGIYEGLISSLSNGFSGVVAATRLDFASARFRFREVKWGLVLPLLAGMVTSVVLGASMILSLIEAHPERTQALFFGLVAASILVPAQRIERWGTREYVVGILGAVLAFVVAGLPQASVDSPSLFRVFSSAALAITAMILPGVSGAFLLKILGLYETSLFAIENRDLLYILVVVLGAGTGLGLFSKVLDYLLKHRHDVTMAALVGMMAGGLRALWPYFGQNGEMVLPSEGDPLLSVILIGLAGFGGLFFLIWYSGRIEKSVESTER